VLQGKTLTYAQQSQKTLYNMTLPNKPVHIHRFVIVVEILIFVNIILWTNLALATDKRILPPIEISANSQDMRVLQYSPPQPTRILLRNGIIVYILQDSELPLVNITAIIKTGSMYDTPGKEGLADLTAQVMRTGGTKTMTGDAIDDHLEFFADVLNVSVGVESTSFTLSTIKDNMEESLKIFSQIIMEPVFEDQKLKLAKALQKEELRRIADDPQKLAFREFTRYLYLDDPRGKLASAVSVDNIARDDIAQFHQRFFQPHNILIAISGDITPQEAIAHIERYFGYWQTLSEVEKPYTPPSNRTGKAYMIKKNIPQSIIVSGYFAPGRNHPDFYAFFILDFILGGGGLGSRIFQEIRNDLGLAYSTGSFYRAKNNYGIFATYAMTNAKNTEKVFSLLESIIEDSKRKQISKNILEWAKKSINNNFIFSFLSADQICLEQLRLEIDQLPEKFFSTYLDKINNISEKDLLNVAQKYFSKDKATTIIVGHEQAFENSFLISKKFQIIEGSP
jgi:predicted Zn-dependent peptidase